MAHILNNLNDYSNVRTFSDSEQVCRDNPDCANEISQTSHVEHDTDHSQGAEFRWRTGPWSQVL